MHSPFEIASAAHYGMTKSMSLTLLCRLLDLESVQADHLVLTHRSPDAGLAAVIIARGESATTLRAALARQELTGPYRLTMTCNSLTLDLGQGAHVVDALDRAQQVLRRLGSTPENLVQILPQGRTMWKLVFQGRVMGFASTHVRACMRAVQLEASLPKAV